MLNNLEHADTAETLSLCNVRFLREVEHWYSITQFSLCIYCVRVIPERSVLSFIQTVKAAVETSDLTVGNCNTHNKHSLAGHKALCHLRRITVVI